MDKPSSNLQVAVSALVAWIFFYIIDVPLGLAGLIPRLAVVQAAATLGAALFFLPLLWWRHKAGYAGAIALGIYGIVNIAVQPMITPFTTPGGFTPLEIVPVAIVYLPVTALLIIFTYRASKEKV